MLSDEEERQESEKGQHPGACVLAFSASLTSLIALTMTGQQYKNDHRGESGTDKDEVSVSTESKSK